MTKHDYSYWFGDVVDRLVSTKIGRTRGSAATPANIHQIYAAAREKYGRPMSLMAAEILKEKVKPKDTVLFITNSHETDGPPGVAALARAVDMGLSAAPVVVTYTAGVDMLPDPARVSRVLPETCVGAGLLPVDYARLRARPHRVSVVGFAPLTLEQAVQESEKIIRDYNPSAVISNEQAGRNVKGVYHSAYGFARESDPKQPTARLDHILDAARAAKIPTISMGDNGNEMGLGSVEEAIRKYHPYGDKCQCPCGSGLATSVKADIAFPVAISNFGCYGIAACLAHVLENAEVFHDGETQKRILHACAATGCCDGVTQLATPTEDGTPYMTGVYVVELLRFSVVQSFKSFERPW